MKVFLFLCLSLQALFVWAEPEIKLFVGSSKSDVRLVGDLKVLGPEGQALFQGKSVNLEVGSGGILELDGKPTGFSELKISSPGVISWGERQFRHNIEARSDKNAVSLTHQLPLESYIEGVVASELPKSWGLEVLKAQAIAARTYAIWQKSHKELLDSSVMDQVYHGVQREHELAKRAVKETAGQILTYRAKPAHTFFHAACGGHTASSEEVFGGNEPYLKGVKCPYCHTSPAYRWKYEISRKDLDKKLGANVSKIKSIGETNSGRVKNFRVLSDAKPKEMKSAELRRILGYSNFRSTLLTKKNFGWGSVEFGGRGFGHGVGMCQWGALTLAKKGKTAKQILDYYYPGTEIRRFY
ncbi:MAG: SpoIID/LytB domain-containing protein [Deltaproteobacteria bacterium]|nr:SpoIID/LytB domain-containing protein [Deltaproteobacteria bacterium]